MLGKLLPFILALVGVGAGVGAGLFLRPAPTTEEHATEGDAGAETGVHATEAEEDGEPKEGAPEYVKLSNQFVIPVVEEGHVAAMVVLSLSLEIQPGETEAVYQREPKLRDVFLQVLFDHANTGGFSGSFTDGANLVVLRTSLKEAAVTILGDGVTDVLITEIARQDS